MSRPLRLEFAGALYHVTSRGDRQGAIFLDHTDRFVWLSILEEICSHHNFVVHGYCQMTNHYHIILETIDPNLTRGMQQLNGLYSQYFNRRHQVVGHVFQGRYKAILVQREMYLAELTRYVELNPVRAGLVRLPEQWFWSSYLHRIGNKPVPPWLDTASVLTMFDTELAGAIAAYRKFVDQGMQQQASPLRHTRHQLLLGDEEFVTKMRKPVQPENYATVCKEQRRSAALSLQEYATQYRNRNEAMARAYHSTAYTMEQIARHFQISSKTVSRAIKKHAGK